MGEAWSPACLAGGVTLFTGLLSGAEELLEDVESLSPVSVGAGKVLAGQVRHVLVVDARRRRAGRLARIIGVQECVGLARQAACRGAAVACQTSGVTVKTVAALFVVHVVDRLAHAPLGEVGIFFLLAVLAD